jgi:hypothetical protein
LPWLNQRAPVPAFNERACVNENLPDGVIALLNSRIDSFEKLEVVVALHGAPESRLSVTELCRVVKLPRETIKQVTSELRTTMLCELTSNDEVRLIPLTEQEGKMVAELVTLYTEDRFAVVKALGQLAVKRIRNMASRTFANAFIIRKDKKNDG